MRPRSGRSSCSSKPASVCMRSPSGLRQARRQRAAPPSGVVRGSFRNRYRPVGFRACAGAESSHLGTFGAGTIIGARNGSLSLPSGIWFESPNLQQAKRDRGYSTPRKCPCLSDYHGSRWLPPATSTCPNDLRRTPSCARAWVQALSERFRQPSANAKISDPVADGPVLALDLAVEFSNRAPRANQLDHLAAKIRWIR